MLPAIEQLACPGTSDRACYTRENSPVLVAGGPTQNNEAIDK